MATLAVYASNDGYVSSSNASYATARSGGTLAATNAGAAVVVGQANSASVYSCTEAFLSFDFGICGDAIYGEYWVTDVPTIYIKGAIDPAVIAANFVVTAYDFNYNTSVDTADWVAGASLTGTTRFTGDTARYTAIDQWLPLVAQTSPQAPTLWGNYARYILYSSRHKANTAPAVGTYEQFFFYGYSTTGTASDPYMVATWCEMDDEAATNDLAGAVGPAALWNRALSAAEVAQVMALGTTIVDHRGDSGTVVLGGNVRTAAGSVVPSTHVRAGWWLHNLDYQPDADPHPRPLLITGHSVNMEAGENNLTIGVDWMEDELGLRMADLLAIPEPVEVTSEEDAAADPYLPETPAADPTFDDPGVTIIDTPDAPIAEEDYSSPATYGDPVAAPWYDATESGGYWATLPSGEQRWYNDEAEYRADL